MHRPAPGTVIHLSHPHGRQLGEAYLAPTRTAPISRQLAASALAGPARPPVLPHHIQPDTVRLAGPRQQIERLVSDDQAMVTDVVDPHHDLVVVRRRRIYAIPAIDLRDR